MYPVGMLKLFSILQNLNIINKKRGDINLICKIRHMRIHSKKQTFTLVGKKQNL
jgi:hypothetical protein